MYLGACGALLHALLRENVEPGFIDLACNDSFGTVVDLNNKIASYLTTKMSLFGNRWGNAIWNKLCQTTGKSKQTKRRLALITGFEEEAEESCFK